MLNNVSKQDHFVKQIKQIQEFCSINDSVVIAGDFNLDYNKSTVHNYSNRALYDLWLEASYQQNLTQLVREVTWSRVYNNVI